MVISSEHFLIWQTERPNRNILYSIPLIREIFLLITFQNNIHTFIYTCKFDFHILVTFQSIIQTLIYTCKLNFHILVTVQNIIHTILVNYFFTF